MILVTGATGMFGSRVTAELVRQGQSVRAMVRDEAKARQLLGDGPELAVADMDVPETLPATLSGVDKVFLVSPMDGRIAGREIAVIDAAKDAGVDLVIKLHGAVKHHDALAHLHEDSIKALRESGLNWALVSPNSVIETTLFSQIPALKEAGAMMGCAADGRVALIAADDVGRATAAVFVRENLTAGEEFILTGPEAVTMAEVAATMTEVLGHPVEYQDLPEQEFTSLLTGFGMTPEQAEIGVIAHFRAWRQGGADVVTDTYRQLTGLEPTSLTQWLEQHRSAFD